MTMRSSFPLIPMLCCAAVSVSNLFLNFFTFPYYADYSWVHNFIATRTTEPRWLIYIKLQITTYHTVESMFFARNLFPAWMHDPLSFARALNVVLLVATGLHCYAAYPKLRPTIGWILTSAAYCFMATGFGKVYSAATALLLLLYCALAEDDFEVSGVVLGAASAFVGLFYLALMPIALSIVGTVLVKRRASLLPTVLSFVLVGYLLIAVFWSSDVASFFPALWAESHFGNQFTDYLPYRGQAASEQSIFFKLSFVLSAKQLGDKLYMMFFSGVLLSFCGVSYEATRVALTPRLVNRLSSASPMLVFCVLSSAACLVVVIGYLSKIGPRGDLAFYSPFIVPFTFTWLSVRRLRRGADGAMSKGLLIVQYVYMTVVVVWSGIVGPPKI